MRSSIFLSYASEQSEAATHIELSLKGDGYSVFRDRTSLPPGESFDARILVYCPIISLTYIYDESYLMPHENSLSHRVVPGRTCGVEHMESGKKFAVAIDSTCANCRDEGAGYQPDGGSAYLGSTRPQASSDQDFQAQRRQTFCRSSTMWSAFISTLQTRPWSCASTRKVKSRHSIVPSQDCRSRRGAAGQ